MPIKMERESLDYENLSEKFSMQVTNYNKQYCSIYLVRLKQMTELLQDRIEKKWKKAYPVYKLHKISGEEHCKCVVIGTLFKNQKLKPSILKQLSEGNALIPQPIVTHFTDKSDELFIEDELQRYQLVGNLLKCDVLVTGVTCALLGTGDNTGKFTVEDYVFPDYQTQIERPVIPKDCFVMFISGLDLINSQNFQPKLTALTYIITNLIEVIDDLESSKIIRVIIAGNSIRTVAERVEPSISMLSRKPESNDTLEAVKILDEFLLHLCQYVDVDLMPGENDPSNHILPQKPMHFCMLPKSSVYKSLNQVTNPYFASIGGVKIMGSSGQPVRDILRYSEIENSVNAMENCLKWAHLAPTAPDTLGCFPFYEEDPFIIHQCPDVMFAGNQQEFATKEVTGPEGQRVRLISIPEFGSTFQVSLLNLRNLECRSLKIS